MRRPFVRTLLAGIFATSLIPVSAQTPESARDRELDRLSGFWVTRFDLEPYEKTMIDALPSGTHLLTDTGTVPELALGDFGGLKLTPQALAQVEAFDPAAQRGPSEACVPPSLVYFMQAPFPMEVHTSPEMIVLKMEYYDLVRIIFLDGREHPADNPHTKSGHSVGHWEGDTLVVDTTRVAAATFMNNGFNHSDDMHVVERFRLSPDGTTLWITQVYDDPATFEGLTARYMAYTKVPEGGYVYPFDCNPGYSLN